MVQKSNAQRLASMALDMGATALRGQLTRENGRWKVGDTFLDAWLEKYGGEPLIVIAVPLEPEAEPTKTCRVCGRDYAGEECPYCREARRRLRGD